MYDDWPKIAKEAYESDLEPVSFEGIDHIVFSGMGGSGAIGDLFLSVLFCSIFNNQALKQEKFPNLDRPNQGTSVQDNRGES